MLFTFSNLTAVWISRNFEDKIINEHLRCYSSHLTPLFVKSFLVCRAGILLCLKQSLLLKYWFSYHLSFWLVCDKSNGARCWSRAWHCCFVVFNSFPLFARGNCLCRNRRISINLILQFNVGALKKLAQHILEKKIENPLKRYQERMRWPYNSSFQAPLFFEKSLDKIKTSRIFLKRFYVIMYR